MYLKSLVLKGFKSFADRSVISLEPGITAVVGPNGSGKSNISDAVLWVLGERNAKNLRGQAMEDVIFAGSSARKAVGVAEVDLILDNSDGTLPIEYNEVAITRRMYRSGESEYLINGTPARRMDVLDILHDTGLGTGTHSIIAQGHLSSILQSKPEDRRMLIEEAAGVLKHKQRKLKSERKLERMDAHLTRVRDIVSEVERQVKPLERKAKRALQYRELAGELAELDLGLAVDDLRNLQRTWDSVLEREELLASSSEELRQRIAAAEEEAEQLQERLQSESSDAGTLAARYRRAQTALDRLDSNILLLHEKKRSTQSYIAEMRLSLEAGDDGDELEAKRAEADETLRQARAAKEASDEKLRIAQITYDELNMKRKALSIDIESSTQRRRETLQDLEAARTAYTRTQEVLAENRAQERMIDTHVLQLEERTSAAQAAREAAQATQVETAEQLSQAKEAESQARDAVGAAFTERDRLQRELEEAREARASSSAEVKSLEELERARAAANPLLAWALEHAGEIAAEAKPLVEHVQAPADLEAVVAELLGRDVAGLLVRDRSAAASLAQRLATCREHGQVTLLPSAGMRKPSAVQGARLTDVLAIDDEARDAVEALLGDVVVCASSDEALRAAEGGACAVTREGTIAWPNGKLTYVNPTAEEMSALSAQRSLADARQALEQATQAQADLEAKYKVAEEQLRNAQSESLSCSQERARLQGAAEAAQGAAERAVQAHEALVAEARSLDEARIAAREALEKAKPDAAQLESRIERLIVRIDEAKEDIERKSEELTSVQQAADDAAAALTEAKLASATDIQQAEYAQRMLLAREQDIRNAISARERLNENFARKNLALQRIDPMIELHKRLVEAASKRLQELEEITARTQDSSAGLHQRINHVRNAAREAHEQFDAANGELTEVRVQKGRLEMQVEQAIETIVHDCNTPLESALELPELENRAEIEEQAFKLRRRIANMGTINPDAADEYEELKSRFDYLCAQLADMEAARRSLARITAIIDARMKDDFVRTFEEVDQNYREIFQVLFPGGSGNLSLVDPDDPENTGVEVNAQPSGKRILKMSLMSGGEQSLVAMALLFAVYKTRSTPFYILDEVEAALDDTNLRRLCAYLDSMRQGTQFIMITHQRRTMEMADVLYGISMQSDGVTKVMSQRLERALRYAE